MERKKHRLATCSSTFTIGGEPFGQWRKQACGRKLSSLIGRNWKTLDFETRQKLILENLPRGNANDQPCYNRALRLLLACAREEKEVGAIGIKRKHIMKRSLSLPEIEKKWSLLTHAPEELKLQFLACLPLSDLVAMAQINKDFLSFIGTHLDGISQIQYPLEDKTMAKCSLAYFEGDKCPTTEAEWKQKGRLLGHDLQDCRIWCQETHLFWDTVLHWIYENIHVEAIEYKGHVYPAQVWNSEQGMDVEPKFFPAPEEIQYILRLKEPVRVWNESEWKTLPFVIPLYNRLSALAQQNDWRKLQIFPKSFREVTLCRGQSDSSDRRGTNQIQVQIPFTRCWILEATCDHPLTLGQVAEGAFRIKRHTFETFYEGFDGVSKRIRSPMGIHIVNRFDYGS